MRITPQPRDQLDGEALALYDRILDARRELASMTTLVGPEGELLGPFDPMLRAPAVGEAAQRLGLALRHETSLDRAVNETVILTVSAWARSGFEWQAHVDVARRLQALDEAAIAAIHDGREPRTATDSCRAAWAFTKQLLEEHRADDHTYGRVEAHLGPRGVTELTLLAGYYVAIGMLMAAYDVEPDFPETWPPAEKPAANR